MAVEWLKIEHTTPDKPEVKRIARKLGIDRDSAFGKLFRMWRWFDQQSDEGKLSGIGLEDIDDEVDFVGFAACAVETGWLLVDGETLVMPGFAKHCGDGAKKRAQTARRVARHAEKTNAASVSTALGNALAERRKEKGEREGEEEFPIAGGPIGAPVDLPPLEDSVSKTGKPKGGPHPNPISLDGLNWPHVMHMAASLGKKVRPNGTDDRRWWFKFAIAAELEFSEHWLMDAAEAVVNSTDHKRTAQAHLVAVLKSKAAEEGFTASAFRELLRRIEVPADVWKSEILKVRQ